MEALKKGHVRVFSSIQFSPLNAIMIIISWIYPGMEESSL